jgi:hypothetical protein
VGLMKRRLLLAALLISVLPAQPDSNQALAHRIALSLGRDPLTVLEIRKQSDGRFRAVLDPQRVESIVLRELLEKP